MFPTNAGMATERVARWIQLITTSPVCFFAHTFAQAMFETLYQPSNSDRTRRRAAVYYSKAIQAVKQNMSKAEDACADDNLLAVLALAQHQPVEAFDISVPTSEYWPKQGPLDSLRLLNIYGGPVHDVPVHAEAFSRLIMLRGGLEEIRLPGLRAMIS